MLAWQLYQASTGGRETPALAGKWCQPYSPHPRSGGRANGLSGNQTTKFLTQGTEAPFYWSAPTCGIRRCLPGFRNPSGHQTKYVSAVTDLRVPQYQLGKIGPTLWGTGPGIGAAFTRPSVANRSWIRRRKKLVPSSLSRICGWFCRLRRVLSVCLLGGRGLPAAGRTDTLQKLERVLGNDFGNPCGSGPASDLLRIPARTFAHIVGPCSCHPFNLSPVCHTRLPGS